MSMESARDFYEKMESEPALQESMKGKTVGELEHLVRDEWGYDFTREEMQKVIFDRNPELTDEELEAVVGGLSQTEKDVIGGVALGVGLAVTGGGLTLVIIAAAA